MKLSEAEEIARVAFGDTRNRFGVLLFEHSVAVAERVTTYEAKLTALLHDVVERTDWTVADLRRHGASATVVDAVGLLTHRAGESYEAFVERIAVARGRAGSVAREVKLADLAENLSRLDRVAPDEAERLERHYRRALDRLQPLVPTPKTLA